MNYLQTNFLRKCNLFSLHYKVVNINLKLMERRSSIVQSFAHTSFSCSPDSFNLHDAISRSAFELLFATLRSLWVHRNARFKSAVNQKFIPSANGCFNILPTSVEKKDSIWSPAALDYWFVYDSNALNLKQKKNIPQQVSEFWYLIWNVSSNISLSLFFGLFRKIAHTWFHHPLVKCISWH